MVSYSGRNLIRHSWCVYLAFSVLVCETAHVCMCVLNVSECIPLSIDTSHRSNLFSHPYAVLGLPFLWLCVCAYACVCVLDKNEPTAVCIHDFQVNGEPTYWVNTLLLLQLSAFNVTVTAN